MLIDFDSCAIHAPLSSTTQGSLQSPPNRSLSPCFGPALRVSILRRRASELHSLLVTRARVISIDVEFAHFAVSGETTKAAAEVCLLQEGGAVLLHSPICPDICALPRVKWIGGVRPEAYKLAASAVTVSAQLLSLMQGCLLVGYGLDIDLAALDVQHPAALQKDLMKCSKFRSKHGQARKLRDVTSQFLGRTIQAGKHSAREDALAVLQLYQLHVKGDPALMTYQELVDHELHNILSSAAGNPD